MAAIELEETIDTTDVDKYVGKEVGGMQLKEPVSLTDIRRWMLALDYFNPIHFDEEAAKRTKAGEILAPQSFFANCCAGHGTMPAIVGYIPGSHVVFGGDEWWFYGPRIRPGDKITTKRRFHGYDIANTKFAGPLMFSHGDTLYLNARGESVAKQRCTMGRYIVEYALKRGYYDKFSAAPEFSAAQLRQFRQMRADWIGSNAEGKAPEGVEAGQQLPVRPVGPHTIASFTKEYSALTFTAWGSAYFEGEVHMDTGWIPEMRGDAEDMALRVGQDDGPASAHTDLSKAKLIGLPRHYGYGSSMGAWLLDYVSYWAGDEGYIRHAKIDYRSPTFEGDIALLHGDVQTVRYDPVIGGELVVVKVRMVNQDDVVLSSGYVEVQLKEF
jgi:hypothetical protein